MSKGNQWSSRLGFILASAGAAIGLGAIWKFPYVTGTSGGGAFLRCLFYLQFLLDCRFCWQNLSLEDIREKKRLVLIKQLLQSPLGYGLAGWEYSAVSFCFPFTASLAAG